MKFEFKIFNHNNTQLTYRPSVGFSSLFHYSDLLGLFFKEYVVLEQENFIEGGL